ncbi:hypothetical protein TWF481_010624 [Arthrobotrys musiformis]|uniref:F-box domain-containing protein n=1 Tax=Arthrobotrys musiformis TaxID=47236 RepID=A0AAV9W1B1_9PEZI
MGDRQNGSFPRSPLLRIPQELLLHILVLLPLDDQITAIKVCSTFHNLILHTPLIRNTRYAIDSGAVQVRGSLNPYPLQDPRFTVPDTHTALGPEPVHPFSKLICASVGDNITRYAFRTKYDGDPQRGMITEDISKKPPTQEEIEAEKNTAIIALTVGIYRFKIQDITNSPFLDELWIRPPIGSRENSEFVNEDGVYIAIECQVFVQRNLFMDHTPDPRKWEERLKITKDTTVRQLTAVLFKTAFRKLRLTGLESNATAENVIRLWKNRDREGWMFWLIHNRTSPETRNMVWKLGANPLGDYMVSRRILETK